MSTNEYIVKIKIAFVECFRQAGWVTDGYLDETIENIKSEAITDRWTDLMFSEDLEE